MAARRGIAGRPPHPQHRFVQRPSKRSRRRGGRPRWFQLYWPNDDAFTKSLVSEPRTRGYSRDRGHSRHAQLWRGARATCRNAYLPFLRGDSIANYLSDPVFRSGCSTSRRRRTCSRRHAVGKLFSYASTTWESLDVPPGSDRAPDRAERDRSSEVMQSGRSIAGMDGIVVSNHGGRQVDGSIATLDALRASARPFRRTSPFCWTPVSEPAPTRSRRSRWVPTRCSSAGPTSGV